MNERRVLRSTGVGVATKRRVACSLIKVFVPLFAAASSASVTRNREERRPVHPSADCLPLLLGVLVGIHACFMPRKRAIFGSADERRSRRRFEANNGICWRVVGRARPLGRVTGLECYGVVENQERESAGRIKPWQPARKNRRRVTQWCSECVGKE